MSYSDVRPEDRPLDYVVLQAPRETALARVAERQGQPAIDREAIARMHASFAHLGRWEKHIVATDGVDPDSVVCAIIAMRDGDLLRL